MELEKYRTISLSGIKFLPKLITQVTSLRNLELIASDNIEEFYNENVKKFSIWNSNLDIDFLKKINKYMPKLEYLDIDLMLYSGPIDDLSLFTNLTTLKVGFCKEFPESISKLTKLVKLWTHNEGPTILPKSLATLPNLKEVYYSVNGNIVDLSPIFNNPNIEILETACVHNDSFVGIDKMKNLKVYRQIICGEHGISLEIFKIQSLEVLHILETDDFEEFPNEVNMLPNLKKLILENAEGTKISNIKAGIKVIRR